MIVWNKRECIEIFYNFFRLKSIFTQYKLLSIKIRYHLSRVLEHKSSSRLLKHGQHEPFLWVFEPRDFSLLQVFCIHCSSESSGLSFGLKKSKDITLSDWSFNVSHNLSSCIVKELAFNLSNTSSWS